MASLEFQVFVDVPFSMNLISGSEFPGFSLQINALANLRARLVSSQPVGFAGITLSSQVGRKALADWMIRGLGALLLVSAALPAGRWLLSSHF